MVGSLFQVTPLGGGHGTADQRQAVERWVREAEGGLSLEVAKAKSTLTAPLQVTVLESWLVRGTGPHVLFDAARRPAPAGQGWDDTARAHQAEIDALRREARAPVRFSDPPIGLDKDGVTPVPETDAALAKRHKAESAAWEKKAEGLLEEWQERVARMAPIIADILKFFAESYDIASLGAEGGMALAKWRLDSRNPRDSAMSLRAAAIRAGGLTPEAQLAERFLKALEQAPETAETAAQVSIALAVRGRKPELRTIEDVLSVYEELERVTSSRRALAASSPGALYQPGDAARDARTPRRGTMHGALAAPMMHASAPQGASSSYRARCSICHFGHDASDCHVRNDAVWANSPYNRQGTSRAHELDRRLNGRPPRAQYEEGNRRYFAQDARQGQGGRGASGRGGRFGAAGPSGGRGNERFGRGAAEQAPDGGANRREAVLTAKMAAMEAKLSEMHERQAHMFVAQAEADQQRASATSLPLLLVPTEAFAGPTTRAGPKGGLRKVNGVPIPESFLPADRKSVV